MTALRGRIAPADIAIAAAVTAALELDAWGQHITPHTASAPAFAVVGASLLFRRIAPLPVLVVGLTALLVGVVAGVSMEKPVTPLLFYALVLYAVGLREELTRALAGLVVALALTYATIVVGGESGSSYNWTDFVFVGLVSSAPWFVGRAMRARVHESEELEQRAEKLERERLQAVAAERGRIARELHDVVAHSVTVMVVQAGAAEQVLERDPAQALAPIRLVQESGRQALVEMTRLVGLLREDGEELGLAPQPKLADLGDLLAQVAGAGLPVELLVEGSRRALPLGVELTAYRVIQEALTNALKHAGDAHAEVRLCYGVEALDVEIVDDGAGRSNGHVGGHGLVGMAERVGVFDGEFVAGPRAGGGFSVRVRLPIETGLA
jgi:signal transduction histidine kinase